jgi:hypothetical protein
MIYQTLEFVVPKRPIRFLRNTALDGEGTHLMLLQLVGEAVPLRIQRANCQRRKCRSQENVLICLMGLV